MKLAAYVQNSWSWPRWRKLEASRLGLLTSRLLRIARLDREEVKPQLELTDLVELVTNLSDQYAERWADRKLSLTKRRLSSRGSR